MGAVDDVLATLREEHRREQVLITISAARSAAIEKAIAALEELGESGRVVKRPVEPVAKRPVGAPPKRAIARQSAKPKTGNPGTRSRADRVASAQAAAAKRATCDICGKEVSAIGIGTHRRTAHGVTPSVKPFTREPITKMPVDEQKIRDAQAGPPIGRPPHYVESTRPPKAEAPAPPAAPSRAQFTLDDADTAIAATG